eukprot:scaffold2446_cov106-Cylindrotheca_fusiformis.AAC.7
MDHLKQAWKPWERREPREKPKPNGENNEKLIRGQTKLTDFTSHHFQLLDFSYWVNGNARLSFPVRMSSLLMQTTTRGQTPGIWDLDSEARVRGV